MPFRELSIIILPDAFNLPVPDISTNTQMYIIFFLSFCLIAHLEFTIYVVFMVVYKFCFLMSLPVQLLISFPNKVAYV